MNSILISAEAADALNEKIRKNIDPTLFLTCNYTLTPATALHWDSRYYLAIQSLYKFAVDTSCITPHLFSYVPEGQKQRFANFRDYIGIIRLLRAMIDHSNSEKNGFFEKKQMDDYRAWQQRILGKPQAETETDFQHLYAKLEELGRELVTQLELFVRLVAAARDKDDIVQRWKKATLTWYCKKQDLYVGQLADIYLANAALACANLRNINSRNIRGKVNGWIQNMLFADLDRKIDNCDALLKKLPASATDKIYEKRNMHTREKERLADSISAYAKGKEITPEICKSYFFDVLLYSQLEATLRDDGVGMLPQELMQADIQKRFAKVRAEDFPHT